NTRTVRQLHRASGLAAAEPRFVEPISTVVCLCYRTFFSPHCLDRNLTTSRSVDKRAGEELSSCTTLSFTDIPTNESTCSAGRYHARACQADKNTIQSWRRSVPPRAMPEILRPLVFRYGKLPRYSSC